MVTNIAAYHFAAVDDPDALAGRLRERAEACALLGTVLVAGEGINLFLAGTDNAIEDFLQQLRADPPFAGLPVKYGRRAQHPAARLEVKGQPGTGRPSVRGRVGQRVESAGGSGATNKK